jgi:ATP-dependent DNA ligase
VAFDLLRLEGDDQRLRPIEARRETLMRLVEGADRMLFSEALAAEGEVVFAKASELGLEGIGLHSPPPTVTTSQWPRALARRTQKPFSTL